VVRLDDVYFEWESRRWLELGAAVGVCRLMLALVRTISELPLSEWEVRRRDAPRPRRGRDLAELERVVAELDPSQVEQFDYLVSQPELPRLTARLRMRRWGGQGTVLMIRGTHARTVYDISAEVMELVEAPDR
jgi:hypothetical protein